MLPSPWKKVTMKPTPLQALSTTNGDPSCSALLLMTLASNMMENAMLSTWLLSSKITMKWPLDWERKNTIALITNDTATMHMLSHNGGLHQRCLSLQHAPCTQETSAHASSALKNQLWHQCSIDPWQQFKCLAGQKRYQAHPRDHWNALILCKSSQ